jgi:hypothetical protein
MNADCYRLVLDKRTGKLIPVAEIATSAGKGRGRARSSGRHAFGPQCWNALYAAIAVAGLAFPLSVSAQSVVLDPAMGGGASVGEAANGVPLVNIADPGGNGNSVYGDRGLYVSNTVSTRLVGGLSAFLGLDAGAVEDNDAAAIRQSIAGAALGVRASLPGGHAMSFTSATPLGAERPEESVVYASLHLRF